jgi:NADPH-dependent 2,4-dienoyl-CoA reductase/sulfur reductase-like enzyme/rhodanese-related sulfurtransferase
MKRVVIIGGVAGGASAAARIRRLDETAQIVILERSGYISYANCGLPYYIGGTIRDRRHLLVTTQEAMKKRFNIDVRTRTEALAIRPAERKVEARDLESGRSYGLEYDSLILSPGAAPVVPDLEGIGLPGIFALRTVEDTDRIKEYVDQRKPATALVVGGGYIGIEMAEALAGRGLAVTVVEMADQVLQPLDADMAAYVQLHLAGRGVGLRLSDAVKGFASSGNAVSATLRSGAILTADLVILAIGVRPETALAKEAGLKIGASGGIAVDEGMRTSDPAIWAVGDAAEVVHLSVNKNLLLPLAGPANKQGRVAADNICGRSSAYKGSIGTSIIKVFDLVAAAAGANEKLLKRFGVPYAVSVTHSGSHAGYYPGSQLMTVKLVYSPGDGRVLGGQIVGADGVDKRIDTIAVAVRHGLTVADLAEYELAYAPPFSSAKDPVNMAGFVAGNVVDGLVKTVPWDGIDQERDFLLDVRTPQEYARGRIGDAVNIEVDVLRDNLKLVPAEKRVVVYCQVGLRAYVACRILSQSGYSDVVNLSGGYRHYSTVVAALGPSG